MLGTWYGLVNDGLFNDFQILGNMKKDPSSLRLSTVMKNLKGLRYLLKVIS